MPKQTHCLCLVTTIGTGACAEPTQSDSNTNLLGMSFCVHVCGRPDDRLERLSCARRHSELSQMTCQLKTRATSSCENPVHRVCTTKAQGVLTPWEKIHTRNDAGCSVMGPVATHCRRNASRWSCVPKKTGIRLARHVHGGPVARHKS